MSSLVEAHTTVHILHPNFHARLLLLRWKLWVSNVPFRALFLFEDDTGVSVVGLEGDDAFPVLGLGVTAETDVLGERCKGWLIGCFIVNESDFILELLGSLLGRL